jgi:hypothetical protein
MARMQMFLCFRFSAIAYQYSALNSRHLTPNRFAGMTIIAIGHQELMRRS